MRKELCRSLNKFCVFLIVFVSLSLLLCPSFCSGAQKRKLKVVSGVIEIDKSTGKKAIVFCVSGVWIEGYLKDRKFSNNELSIMEQLAILKYFDTKYCSGQKKHEVWLCIEKNSDINRIGIKDQLRKVIYEYNSVLNQGISEFSSTESSDHDSLLVQLHNEYTRYMNDEFCFNKCILKYISGEITREEFLQLVEHNFQKRNPDKVSSIIASFKTTNNFKTFYLNFHRDIIKGKQAGILLEKIEKKYHFKQVIYGELDPLLEPDK